MIKIVLKTNLLQKMLSKCMKCVVNNKIRPISSMVCIKLKNNVFSVTATDDNANIIHIKEDKIIGEDFSVVIIAEKFYKLVQKTTVEQIVLTLKENYLEFKGNGVYKIELSLNENNELTNYGSFPEIMNYNHFLKNDLEKENLFLSTIKNVVSLNKIGLANVANYTQDRSTMGYYCDENIITSTGTTLVLNKIKLLKNKFLGSKELFNLLLEIDDENILVFRFENKILFKTTNVDIFSTELEDDRNFNYDTAVKFSDSEFISSCKISRNNILNALDRVNLFIKKMDEDVIRLIFTDKGIIVENKSEIGSELIDYVESNNFKPFACYLILSMLKDIISPQKADLVELFYGRESELKSSVDDTKFFIRLYDSSMVNSQINKEEFKNVEIEDNVEKIDEKNSYSERLIGEDEIPF